MSCSTSVNLNNGTAMPMLGLGTFKIKEDMVLEQALDCAIKNGYRLIDTATVYKNEQLIGRCLPTILSKYGLKRRDVFITTKLGPKDMDREKVVPAVEASLTNLNLEYIDLYLIHWPAKQGMKPDDLQHATVRKQCWEILEDIHLNTGQLKAIGLSNYTSKHLKELLASCRIKPAVLQSELHPDYIQQDLLNLCTANSIHFQSYSSLGAGSLIGDERFGKIAENCGKSIPQVLLRWAIEKGCSVIPKSVNEDHIKANSCIFDFSLSNEDMDNIQKLTANTKFCWDPNKVA